VRSHARGTEGCRDGDAVRKPPGSGLYAVLAAATACSPGPGSHPARSTDQGWIDAPVAASSAAPRREERWDLAEQLAALRPAFARARSEHLGGGLEGEVLAATTSGYPLHGPTSVAAVGMTLVERLFEPGRKEPATYFVMVKRAPGYDPPGADWEYVVVAPDSHVEERGRLALCARCHAEAAQDHTFGRGH
jgi:hypothetical protein